VTDSGDQQNINDTQSITVNEGKGTVPIISDKRSAMKGTDVEWRQQNYHEQAQMTKKGQTSKYKQQNKHQVREHREEPRTEGNTTSHSRERRKENAHYGITSLIINAGEQLIYGELRSGGRQR